MSVDQIHDEQVTAFEDVRSELRVDALDRFDRVLRAAESHLYQLRRAVCQEGGIQFQQDREVEAGDVEVARVSLESAFCEDMVSDWLRETMGSVDSLSVADAEACEDTAYDESRDVITSLVKQVLVP